MKKYTFVLALSLAIGVSAFAQDLPIEDADFACTTEADAARYIKDFSININSFGGKELCKPTAESKMLFNALTLIDKGNFGVGGSNVFLNGFVTDSNYYNYMVKETRGIKRGNDIPTATAYNSFGFFTLQDGWAQSASLARVSVLIHEARHTEGYRHITCVAGPYQKTTVQGCDSTLSYGGSHGVEIEYYARVLFQGQNFSPVYSSMARLMAVGRGNWVFNKTPITARKALVLVDSKSQQPVLVDGDKVIDRVGPSTQGAVLKSTSAGATYFYGDRVYAIDLYGNEQGDYKMQDDYTYFKFIRSPNYAATQSVDLEEHDIGTRRFFVSLDKQGALRSYNYGKGAWSAPTSSHVASADRLVTVTPSGQEGFFALTQNGSLLPFNPETLVLGSALNESWPQTAEAYVKYQNQTLMLGSDGVVYNTANKVATQPYALLQGRTFSQMVSAPLYDAFDVSP